MRVVTDSVVHCVAVSVSWVVLVVVQVRARIFVIRPTSLDSKVRFVASRAHVFLLVCLPCSFTEARL